MRGTWGLDSALLHASMCAPMPLACMHAYIGDACLLAEETYLEDICDGHISVALRLPIVVLRPLQQGSETLTPNP